jgi:hypothetical protein
MTAMHGGDMTRRLITLFAACSVLALGACRTVGTTAAGAAVGAGIGSIRGDTENGAIVGGSVGLLAGIIR